MLPMSFSQLFYQKKSARYQSTSFLTSCLLLVILTLLQPLPLLAQSDIPITYERYDSEITINADGTFRVREIQQIRFDDVFETAFAEIPSDLVGEIREIQVYEAEDPYLPGSGAANTFTIDRDGAGTYVEWSFTPTEPGDVRTFVLEYLVEGGLWVYPNEQVFEWRAVPADRGGILVEASTVTVTVPDGLVAERLLYTAYGPEFTATTAEEAVLFSATEPLPDGLAFQVQVGLPASATAAVRQPWQEQEDSAQLQYRFGSIDIELTLDQDGALQVEERHQINVSEGALDMAYRVIPMTYIDTISDIRLREGDQEFSETNAPCDYCFQTTTTPRRTDWVTYDLATDEIAINENRAGAMTINWQFPPLVRGEATTFTLRYQVAGAIQQLDDRQQLNWGAVFADRDAPVTAASLQLHLPATLSTSDVEASGGNVEAIDENTLRLVAPTAIEPGRPWEVYFTLPPDALAMEMPAWQMAMAAAVDEAENAATRRARTQVGFGVLGLLLALLGPLGVYLIWYNRGRDLPLPAIADYLPEPPSTLPPAIVAYLLDEEPSTKGALASLFHLATLGLLRIRFDGKIGLKRLHEEEIAANTEVTTPESTTVQVPPHLATLFNALRPELPLETEVSLSALQKEFRRVLPVVYSQMGEEATHFFDELPDTARRRWLVRGQWLVILGFVVALVLGFWYSSMIGWVALLPALGLLLTGAVLIWVSRWMPRRTNAGVEEAQRWRAFRTYLQNLKEYAGVDDAQRILDRYFAYAVALDVEKVVLRQAEELGGRLPPWTYTPTWEPRWRPYGRGFPQSMGRPTVIPTSMPDLSGAPSGGTEASEPPSLSGMSRKLGNALGNASSNLGSLLRQAVGPEEIDTPFESIWSGTQSASKTGGKVAVTTLKVLGEILAESSSGGGGGGYSSSGSRRSSWSSGSSRRSSSSSMGRSSSSRRSGGGGRRGFR